jgi:hypothetical protein
MRWQPSWISDRHIKQKIGRGPSNDHSWAVWFQLSKVFKTKLYMNVHWMVLYKLKVFCSDMKFKMEATTGLSLTLDSEKNVSKRFISETPWTIETKLPRNDHWEKKAFEHFPIGSNVNLCIAVVAILDFRSS